jgi:ubiquinone biosynthesis protein COQ9
MTDDSDLQQQLLAAIMPHVIFDGWSDAAFRAACGDLGLSPDAAMAACPRGALDLAIASHQAGDAAMVARLREADTAALRFRERIALALKLRLEVINDRETVRRASALFALPQHSAEGARLMWNTADLIWRTLGDRSDDLNWYTKRATLAGVLGAVVLYWLGDDSPAQDDTAAFIDRRIDDVMRLETLKQGLRSNPATRGLMKAQEWVAGRVRAPVQMDDLPGRWRP